MEPRVVGRDTQEYKKLTAVAKMLEALSPNNARYEVENVYFDFGQEWSWTTICRKDYRECQVLNPKEWEEIMLAETTGDYCEAVVNIRTGKYFGDY